MVITLRAGKQTKILPVRPQVYCAYPYRNQRVRVARKERENNCKLLGLNHVFNRNYGKPYRLLWAVFIATNICICTLQIYDRVNYFLGHPLRTDVAIEQQQNVQFPSFTVCPYGGQYPNLQDEQKKIVRERKKDSLYCQLRLNEIIEYSNLDLEMIWNNTSILDKIMQYNLRDYKTRNANTTSKLKWKEVKNTLGMCHTFIVPDVPIHNSIWRVMFKIDFNSSCDALVLIAMHPDEDYPNIYSDMNPHYFKRGTAQMYSLAMQKFVRKSIQERPCKDKRLVSKCRRDCYYKTLLVGLRCRLPHIPLTDLSPCKNSREALKAMKYEEKFQNNFDVFVNCSHCLVKCEEIMYIMNLLHSEKRNYDKYLITCYSFETNVLIVVYEEYAYLLVSLLCDIGGNLGLFLGLCLVSIAEMFEKAVSKIVTAVHKKRA